ncbi:MAG: tyrosine-type recombinase/integrase [Chloroflexi bacterium]|nr:tyrosine-type recombinase/integrase [Chloroflexota bacterium]
MTTLQDALAEFILAQEADGSSASTVRWYRSLLGAYADQNVGVELKDVSAHDLRHYITALPEQGYEEETVKGHRRALHKFWAWAHREYDLLNPMRNIAYPKPPKPNPQPARMEDVRLLFKNAGERVIGIRNRAIMALLLDTGCRRNEISQMNIADLHMESNTIMVMRGKGNKIRAVKFTQFTNVIVREWLAVRVQTDALFYDLDTLDRLLPNGIGQMLKRIARRVGVEGRISAHRWRDLFATQYILNGGDLVTLSKLLGHNSINTTVDHYIAFTDLQISEAHNRYSPMGQLINQIRKDKLKEIADAHQKAKQQG